MQARALIESTGKLAAIGAAFLVFTPLARAQEVETEASSPRLAPFQLSVKLEPAVAVPLTDPQSRLYEPGGGQTIKLLFGLTPYLAVGPSASFTALPANAAMASAGTSWSFGAGARVMRPHNAAAYYGLSPWIDADLLYVRTGGLDRAGFAAAAGVALPIDASRRFWLGPFARYGHIFQGDRIGFDNRDAKILSIGLSLEIGTGLERQRERVVVAEAPAVPEATPVQMDEPDRDGDGVLDKDDVCPDVAGSAPNHGCAVYDKVIIKPDKLELTERIQFAFDKALLEPASYRALDAVVTALQDNKTFRVEITGHASSEGMEQHNQTLSEQRAEAVLDYLVSHGVARDRLASKGFSSSQPRLSNDSSPGREVNRRVEFIVELIIVKEGNTP